MDESGRVAVVLTTVPDAERGEALARTLVDERLVACGNLVPGITSIFRWSGEVQKEGEVLLVLKTRADGLGPLFARMREIHPYDVPEMLALPVLAGSTAYCDWVAQETGGVSR